MPKHRYIGGVDYFHCPKGSGPHRTMLKASCRNLSIPQLKAKTGIKEDNRHRWKRILGFMPRPHRGRWYGEEAGLITEKSEV